jgi:hypothetical protein
MIEAGVYALDCFNSYMDIRADAVRNIYLAMEKTRVTQVVAALAALEDGECALPEPYAARIQDL